MQLLHIAATSLISCFINVKTLVGFHLVILCYEKHFLISYLIFDTTPERNLPGQKLSYEKT